MRKIAIILLISLTSQFGFAVPKIILKLDDFNALNGSSTCLPVLNYLVQKQIKAGFGAIANKFDSNSLTLLSPYLTAKNSKGELLFEIWHHGLDHVEPEFLGTDYQYQKAHFDQASLLIKQYLNLQMHTFGAPFNHTDATTNTVISENLNYKVAIFSTVKPAQSNGILYLNNRVDMENGAGNPEYQLLVDNYNHLKSKYTDYMILQGHPGQWTSAKLDQFKLIIDFLIAEGCEFVLPYDYCLSLSALPVSSLFLKASLNNNNSVILNWSTATEQNNARFEVLRYSEQNTLPFKLASVAGQGNSVIKTNYSYIDNKPLSGTSYYQLSQVDFDGKATLSNIQSIKNGLIETPFYVFQSADRQYQVSVNLTEDAQVILSLTNMNGKILFEKHLQLVKGNTILSFNEELQPGTYVCSLEMKGVHLIKKFTVC